MTICQFEKTECYFFDKREKNIAYLFNACPVVIEYGKYIIFKVKLKSFKQNAKFD